MKRQYVRPYNKKDGTEVDEYDRSLDAARFNSFQKDEFGFEGDMTKEDVAILKDKFKRNRQELAESYSDLARMRSRPLLYDSAYDRYNKARKRDNRLYDFDKEDY